MLTEVYDELCFSNEAVKIVSEYDQEKPLSQTTDNPMVPRRRAPQS